MMTSQLQPRDVGVGLRPTLELFRYLKKTAILLMLLFRLDKPVGESEIASILDMYPTTLYWSNLPLPNKTVINFTKLGVAHFGGKLV